MKHEDYNAYLFVYFTGEYREGGEEIYFAVSRDGLHYEELNRNEPVLISTKGEQGVRDPFIIRGRNGGFYIIATDLCINRNRDWGRAQTAGSKDIVIWESQDLVHWQEPQYITVAREDAGCTWAPEAVYDEKTGEYVVFFASRIKADNFSKQRIYRVTTKDFHTFSAPELFVEHEKDVIDATILYENGVYYRYSKDEVNKNIVCDKSTSLLGTYTILSSQTIEQEKGVEGPEIFKLNHENKWCLLFDAYGSTGYYPLISEDIANGVFRKLDKSEYKMPQGARHGSVIPITETEYQSLIEKWRIKMITSKDIQIIHQETKNEETTLYYRKTAEKKAVLDFGERTLNVNDITNPFTLSNQFVTPVECNNPALKGLFADPDIREFNGTYYIYPTSDGFAGWSGTQFHVFSSKDLTCWHDEGIIVDVATDDVPWAVGSAWAPTAETRNGKYYFYFCAKRPDGKSCIGAAVSDTPVGPFVAKSEPLITPELIEQYGVSMWQTIDPSVFTDEDGKPYLYFGNGTPAVVELNDDMVSVKAETFKNISGCVDFREAVCVIKREGIYHFTWSCDDTGSENYHLKYGISDSPYGPVQYQYMVLSKNKEQNILGTGHHSLLKTKEGQYVIAYHRFGTPLENYPRGKGFNRETCLDFVTFNEKGLMNVIKPTLTGIK